MEYIAKMSFKVTITKNYILDVDVYLIESGASAYGNRTAVYVEVNGAEFQCFDTRFLIACDTVSGFEEYFTQWVIEAWQHDGQIVDRIN